MGNADEKWRHQVMLQPWFLTCAQKQYLIYLQLLMSYYTFSLSLQWPNAATLAACPDVSESQVDLTSQMPKVSSFIISAMGSAASHRRHNVISD
jgi:hypothetical protein